MDTAAWPHMPQEAISIRLSARRQAISLRPGCSNDRNNLRTLIYINARAAYFCLKRLGRPGPNAPSARADK